MTENQITSIIIGTSIDIHRALGPGLLESVYQKILVHRLRREGFEVEEEKHISITFDDLHIEKAFRVDLIVEKKVLVELKSIKEIPKVDYKRFTTYLRLANIEVGLLINFGEEYLKDGIKRAVNGYRT